jgi:hypothetical protein
MLYPIYMYTLPINHVWRTHGIDAPAFPKAHQALTNGNQVIEFGFSTMRKTRSHAADA